MSKHGKPYNVLFLCTGNSARSILAEAVVRTPSSIGSTASEALTSLRPI